MLLKLDQEKEGKAPVPVRPQQTETELQLGGPPEDQNTALNIAWY